MPLMEFCASRCINQVVEVAQAVHRLLDKMGAASYCKTSGSPRAARLRTAWRAVPWAAARSVTGDTPSPADHRAESDLIREIFGNPFKSHAILPEPTAAFWESAKENYEQRSFDRLPVLANVLEDAGCTNADILNHYRQGPWHRQSAFRSW